MDDIDAILAVPEHRERFRAAMDIARSTNGVPDDPDEIERRLQERFSTKGKDFLTALRLVIAGGPDEDRDAEREANE